MFYWFSNLSASENRYGGLIKKIKTKTKKQITDLVGLGNKQDFAFLVGFQNLLLLLVWGITLLRTTILE